MCFEKRKDFSIKGEVNRIIIDILKSKIKGAHFHFVTNYYKDEEINELIILAERNNLSFSIKKEGIFTNFSIHKKE